MIDPARGKAGTRLSRARALLAASLLIAAGASHAAIFTPPRSIEDLQKKLANFSEDDRSSRKAHLAEQLGDRLYDAGRMPEAAVAYETALEARSSRLMRRHIYLYLAKSYESSGRADKAVDAYKNALTYDARNWRRYRDLGRVYQSVKLYSDAIAAFEQGLQQKHDEPEIYFALGSCWREAGIYTHAENYLKKALALGHDASACNRELSYVYEGEGRFADAALAFEKCSDESLLISDAARLVYLGALGKNAALAQKGLDRLKTEGAPAETLRFYDNFVVAARQPLSDLLAMNGSRGQLSEFVQGILAPEKK